MPIAKPAKNKATAKKKLADRKKQPCVRTGAIGRPSNFRADYIQVVFDLCLLGFTDAQLSEVFQVSEVTLRSWKKKQPGFLLAMRKGKAIADACVAQSLYNRAIGITIEEFRETLNKDGDILNLKTTRQIPGDVAAQKMWLKNRQPELWKDNIGVTDGQGGAFSIVIHEELRPESS